MYLHHATLISAFLSLILGSNVKVLGPCIIHKMRPDQQFTQLISTRTVKKDFPTKYYNISSEFEIKDFSPFIWKINTKTLGKCGFCLFGIDKMTDLIPYQLNSMNTTVCLDILKTDDYTMVKFESYE